MYDLILFDLDGTLTDSKEGIINCVNYALCACGLPERPEEELLCFIGPPLIDSFMEFCGMDRRQASFAVEKYRERFRDVGIYENRVYPGIGELLKALKAHGKTVALATSKPHVFADRILEQFALAQYFDFTTGAELDGTRNAKKDVIQTVLAQFPAAKSPVMIGDRAHDVLGAKACGIPCIGVAYGYAEPQELERAGAGKIVQTVHELQEFLIKYSF